MSEILFRIGTSIKGNSSSCPSFETGQTIQSFASLASGTMAKVANAKNAILADYPFVEDAVHCLSTCREVPIAQCISHALTTSLVSDSLPWSSIASLSNQPTLFSSTPPSLVSLSQPVFVRSAHTSPPYQSNVPPPLPVEGSSTVTAIPMTMASLTGATAVASTAQ
ncbi:hypothetical protein GYMLUDRAFT_252910 [Collybiopsis luxurians FD-317 M1]|uniref:Uncharacterized protein n=1 Tax=Collybiopsis luxurians FD-317 M1 TaxID=944289 RepID=A0A0D0C741_9AGAR|nr:hypothetical protein GYMLUDRAFT_252910 [Collybiopsis luxurians FD-317 M1]